MYAFKSNSPAKARPMLHAYRGHEYRAYTQRVNILPPPLQIQFFPADTADRHETLRQSAKSAGDPSSVSIRTNAKHITLAMLGYRGLWQHVGILFRSQIDVVNLNKNPTDSKNYPSGINKIP
jgi:hypothetical protein